MKLVLQKVNFHKIVLKRKHNPFIIFPRNKQIKHTHQHMVPKTRKTKLKTLEFYLIKDLPLMGLSSETSLSFSEWSLEA